MDGFESKYMMSQEGQSSDENLTERYLKAMICNLQKELQFKETEVALMRDEIEQMRISIGLMQNPMIGLNAGFPTATTTTLGSSVSTGAIPKAVFSTVKSGINPCFPTSTVTTVIDSIPIVTKPRVTFSSTIRNPVTSVSTQGFLGRSIGATGFAKDE